MRPINPSYVENAIGQKLAVDEAAEVASRCTALDRHCWRNGIRALRICYRRDPTACYVEGWAVSKFGLVCEHGWVEAGLGESRRIIDPTPSWRETGDGMALPVYFPAKRYAADAVPKAQKAWTCDVPLVAGGRGFTTLEDPEYRAAYVEAWRTNMGCSAEAAEGFLFAGNMDKLIAERKGDAA